MRRTSQWTTKNVRKNRLAGSKTQKVHVEEMPAWSMSSSPDKLRLDLQHGRFSFLHGTKVQPGPTADIDESEDPILGSAPTETDLLEASAPTETLPHENDVPDCTHLVSGSWELPSFHPRHVSTTSLTWGFMAAAIVMLAAAHFFQRMRKQRRRTLARQSSLPFSEKGVLAVPPK